MKKQSLFSSSDKRNGLRKGYTTGTCAQAAAKAAAIMLTTEKIIKSVGVELPNKEKLCLPLIEQKIGENFARCAVIKDAGDDPDVTDGIKVFCEVRISDNKGITIKGGPGVGVVTKPGLAIPVGESAINPVPRKMITREVLPYIPADRGLEVIVSVPEGKELAKKTWNFRLGIIGGISIIGTTGIVEPKSIAAYQASISLCLDVALASGHRVVFITPGYVGERALREKLSVPEEAVVKIGDYIGYALDQCVKKKVQRVLLIGHIGKLAKVAAGLFNTHSKFGDARLETVAAYAAASGANSIVVKEILKLKLAEASIEILRKNNLMKTFPMIAGRVIERSREYTKSKLEIACILLSLKGDILASEPEKLTEKEKWKKFISLA